MLVTSAGWTVLNQIAIPFVAVSAFASALLWLKRRRAAARMPVGVIDNI